MIIDTHALIRTHTGYFPGLPIEVLQILSPTDYVLVECLPHVILERRKNDHSRTRDKEILDELHIHQELTRSFVTSCCMQTESLLCYIQNNNASINQNTLPLIRYIQSATKEF